jgi:beta-lactam-binding protein with PASTA domain
MLRSISVVFVATALVGCSSNRSALKLLTPHLRGLSHEAAVSRIIVAGLCPGESRIAGSNGVSGTVIRQTPSPGALVDANTRISVVIGANGPYAEITTADAWPKRCRD